MIAQRHLLKSQIGIAKCYLVSKQPPGYSWIPCLCCIIDPLSVRRLMKLYMKWALFINNYQKSTLGGPMMKQFVFQSCLFMIYWNLLIWQTKGLIFLMNLLPDLYICSLRKKSAPLLPEGTVKCSHLAALQIHRGCQLN